MRFLWNLYVGFPVGIPLYFSWISILFLWDFYWVLLWFPDMFMWFFMLIRWYFWWGSYGTLLRCPWCFFDISLGFLWCFHDISICGFHGNSMTFWWDSYMPPFWDVHDVSLIFLWDSCVISMVYPCNSYGIPVCPLLHVHEVSMESL